MSGSLTASRRATRCGSRTACTMPNEPSDPATHWRPTSSRRPHQKMFWPRRGAVSVCLESRRSSGRSRAPAWCSCLCADLVLLPVPFFQPSKTRGDDLGETPRACSGPVEPPDELPVHEDRIALGGRIHRCTADRGVPRRDREGEETSARLRNGDTQLGDLVTRRHAPGDRIGRHGPRQHHDVDREHVRPLPRQTLAGGSDTRITVTAWIRTTGHHTDVWPPIPERLFGAPETGA